MNVIFVIKFVISEQIIIDGGVEDFADQEYTRDNIKS